METIQFEQKEFKHFDDLDEGDRQKMIQICLDIFPDFQVDRLLFKLKEASNFLLIIAKHEGNWVGFKFGFARAPDLFYSMLGGVTTPFRKKGLAQEMMNRQHEWCRKKGYKKVQTKTLNQWKSMLILNIRNGFDIVKVYQKEGQPLKIILEKDL